VGIIARAFASERKSLSLYNLLRDSTGWASSASGKVVNEKTALQVSTVLACARVRANGMAQVPFKLLRLSKDGKNRVPATDLGLYDVLANRPNEWQTSFEYRQTLALHLVLCGNHYSFINRSNRSGVMELIPFEPGQVVVKRSANWELTYQVHAANGKLQTFPANAIWHVKGPSWNSWMGLDSVRLARDAIGLSMALEEQQAKLQKNGVRTSGTYSVEGKLAPDQYKLLRDWIAENQAGPENDGKAMIVDRAAKWLPNAMTGVDAQTLETRRFQVEEVCRDLNVNPIMIFAESKNTTYASAEQMFLAHVVHTLSPDYFNVEQSVDTNLLTEAERKDGVYSCFIDEGLLRGSLTSKHEIIRQDVNAGIITPNEGRALLDMPPDENPESDKLRIPANVAGKPQEVKP
jgi:HK97 family phage portal protein